MSNKAKVNTSVGPFFILFIVFLVLKLCGVIAWSWLWVTSPLWISFGFVIIVMLFVVGLVLLKE